MQQWLATANLQCAPQQFCFSSKAAACFCVPDQGRIRLAAADKSENAAKSA